MGTGKTDQEGIAKITISSAILPAVKDGMITHQALFKGTSKSGGRSFNNGQTGQTSAFLQHPGFIACFNGYCYLKR